MKPWTIPLCTVIWCEQSSSDPATDLCDGHTVGWRETLALAERHAHDSRGIGLSFLGVAALHARWVDQVSRLAGPMKRRRAH